MAQGERLPLMEQETVYEGFNPLVVAEFDAVERLNEESKGEWKYALGDSSGKGDTLNGTDRLRNLGYEIVPESEVFSLLKVVLGPKRPLMKIPYKVYKQRQAQREEFTKTLTEGLAVRAGEVERGVKMTNVTQERQSPIKVRRTRVSESD